MHSDKARYKIVIKGRLKADWSEWFDNLHVSHTPNGKTVLSGPVADQAELFGLLLRIRDLGLPLELVVRMRRSRNRAHRRKRSIK